MKLKLLLLFGLLNETVNVVRSDENRKTEMSDNKVVSKIFIKNNLNTCVAKNLQKSFEGGAEVAKTYPGPVYQVGDRLISSWKVLLDKLEMLSRSNSTILQSGSTEILTSISLLNKFGISPANILLEFAKVMPKYSEARQNIVSNLSGSIGSLTKPINEAISHVSSDTIDIIKQLQKVEGKRNRCEKIDFKPLIKSAQVLTNVIALIVKTSLNICGLKTDVYEALAVVTLTLHSTMIGVMGTYTNIAAILYSESDHGISAILNNCMLALTQLIQGMSNSIKSMTDTEESVLVVLKDFVELNYKFNEQLCSFGLGFSNETQNKNVKLTIEEIKRQLDV